MSLLSVRRKSGELYRLYRDSHNSKEFWMEGPFGPRKNSAYVFLGDSPLREISQKANSFSGRAKPHTNKIGKTHEEFMADFEDSAEYWRRQYPAHALLDREISLDEQQGKFLLSQFGIWRKNLLMGLLSTGVLGFGLLSRIDHGELKDVFVLGFSVLSLSLFLFVYFLLFT
ncbi:MAG: hypothetical protein KDD35_01805 [Bdellovibrionales bacterium]|nr:hypothetical protein [Bdellovibrionales bacterium]